MRIRGPVILCAVVALCLTTSPVFGQDFDQLLKAVDKIETNLKAMVEQESRNRAQAIEKLRKAIHGSRASSPDIQNSELSELKSEFATLRDQIASLSEAMVGKQITETDLADLVSEISTLRAEIESLRYSKGAQARLLVSSDESSAYALGFAPQGSDLSANLQSGGLSGLRISGFFDVTGAYRNNSTDETQFDLGQVEIDLDHDVSDRTYIRITPVYNNSTGSLSLGPVYTRINVYNNEQGPFSSISFSVGKMDIPFGISLLENASKNRKLPTRPKVIGLTHGGWGDYGVQFSLETAPANFVFYVLNGFTSTLEVDSALSLSLGLVEGMEINTTPAYAFGTRIGFTPQNSIEIGISIATGLNQSDKDEMLLFGTDIQYSTGLFELKGEFISHSLNRSIAETHNRGYYLENRWFVNKFTIASRYGSFKPDNQQWSGRFAIGAGYAVTKNVELKFESLMNEDSNDNTITFQLVSIF